MLNLTSLIRPIQPLPPADKRQNPPMFIGKPFDGEIMADLRRGMDRKRSTMLL